MLSAGSKRCLIERDRFAVGTRAINAQGEAAYRRCVRWDGTYERDVQRIAVGLRAGSRRDMDLLHFHADGRGALRDDSAVKGELLSLTCDLGLEVADGSR